MNIASIRGNSTQLGLVHAFSAGAIWGILPLYWYLLANVNPMEVLAHRIFWAWIAIGIVLFWRGKLMSAIRMCTASKKTTAYLALSAILISSNWLVYIWAIKNHHVLETSLGYFISPLMSVLLGALVLRERMHRLQWIALAIVGVAILYQIVHIGAFPWIALMLASTFACYGLIKKTVALDSLAALWFETMIAILPAFIIVRFIIGPANLQFGASTWSLSLLLAGCGVVTLIPMLLFAEATQRLNLSTMGFLHFIAPTIQFILAISFFGDRPDHVRWLSFICVWFAIGLFLVGQWRAYKSRTKQAVKRAQSTSSTTFAHSALIRS